MEDITMLKARNVQKWMTAYMEEKNVMALAVQLIHTPSWAHFPVSPTHPDVLKRRSHGPALTLILADLPPKIICAVIQGTIHRKVLANEECKRWREDDRAQHASDHLSIYINAVVTKGGHHPTLEHTMAILDAMSSYTQGEPRALEKINSAINPKDWLHEPEFQAFRYIANASMMEKVRQFVKMASKRCEQAIAAGAVLGEPIEYGFHEVGYAKNAEDRIKSHQKHNSSNAIMNLFEAAAQSLYPNRYRTEGIILFRIRTATQAALAEIYMTILAHAWAFDGTGFTHHWPGGSIQSARNAELVIGTDIPLECHAAREYHFAKMAKSKTEEDKVNEMAKVMEDANAKLEASINALKQAIEKAEAVLQRQSISQLITSIVMN